MLTFFLDVMHWISKQPSDLQLFGVCSKSATNVLREANGNMISARPSFKGAGRVRVLIWVYIRLTRVCIHFD